MKKRLVIPVLFLFLSSFFLFPRETVAQACCPDTGTSQYKYQYDPSNNKCCLTGPHGTVCVNSECTSEQVCNTSTNQCETYQEPTIPTGCSTDPTGRKFCTTVTGPQAPTYTIYCSTQQECDKYIQDNPYSDPTPTPTGTGGVGTSKGPPITCGDDGTGIDTAIGCISFANTTSFLGNILSFAIGIGGGIAFLLMLFAGFQIMTSTGNPERLKAGQELLTSAIAGLILLVFSVFILRTIGVDILGIQSLGVK